MVFSDNHTSLDIYRLPTTRMCLFDITNNKHAAVELVRRPDNPGISELQLLPTFGLRGRCNGSHCGLVLNRKRCFLNRNHCGDPAMFLFYTPE